LRPVTEDPTVPLAELLAAHIGTSAVSEAR
jgi:hypothetical protein